MSTNKPLVSIIIPCFNSAKFVSRSIDSALSQSYPYTEIILVDNNSTDETLSILKDYQSRYPDKITVLTELKKGAPAARNQGLNAAKGEWIQFLDADDEILTAKIDIQVNLALQTNCHMIIGNSIHHKKYHKKKVRPNKKPWVALINSRLGITSSNLWSANLLTLVNGWDEEITSSQEYHLLFKILKMKPTLSFDNNFNTLIYHQENSVSKATDTKKLYNILTNARLLRMSIKKYLQENNLYGKSEERAYERFIFRHIVQYKQRCPEYYHEFKHLLKNNKYPLLSKCTLRTIVKLKPMIFFFIDLIKRRR